MSGGVGPTGGGITLPSSTAAPPPLHPTPTSSTTTKRPHHYYYLYSVKQLNTLAAMGVLAASATVPLSDIAFALLALPYLFLLCVLSFPQTPNAPAPTAPVFVGPARLLLGVHIAVGFLLGVLLPAAYILDGLRAADTVGVAAASPHAFLLAAQVFTEGVVAAWPGWFSLPVRAAVPVMYNARRMFAAMEWLQEEMGKCGEVGVGGAAAVPQRRVVAGRVLAVGNLMFWGLNLFGFLLPFYLPRALKRYYCGTGTDGGDAKEQDEGKKDS